MTNTEARSLMNVSNVSFVKKCTSPGSLLQSGGGGGGAGFWGLRQRKTKDVVYYPSVNPNRLDIGQNDNMD